MDFNLIESSCWNVEIKLWVWQGKWLCETLKQHNKFISQFSTKLISLRWKKFSLAGIELVGLFNLVENTKFYSSNWYYKSLVILYENEYTSIIDIYFYEFFPPFQTSSACAPKHLRHPVWLFGKCLRFSLN